MEEQGALIFAHLMMGVSTLLPALIMKNLDLDDPNMWIGYRTPWSMKSVHTWRYANTKSADYLLWTALSVIAIQATTFFLLEPEISLMIAAGTLVVAIAAAMIKTEVGLRQNFDKEGNPKIDLDRF